MSLSQLSNLDLHSALEKLEELPYLVIVDGDTAGGPVGDAMDGERASSHAVYTDQTAESCVLRRCLTPIESRDDAFIRMSINYFLSISSFSIGA